MWERHRFVDVTAVFLCCILLNPLLSNALMHVCYYAGPQPELKIDDLEPDLCTHIILGFGRVKNDVLDLEALGGLEAVRDFARLRDRNQGVRLMLSVGGDSGFRRMVTTPSSIARFAKSVVTTVRSLDMDGIDLDWEFPGYAQSRKLTLLLTSLNAAFKNESLETGRDKLILSVAVPAPVTLIAGIYDVVSMAEHADFVNLMTYDMNLYKWYTPYTGHNSPLFGRQSDAHYFKTLNMKFAAEYWTSAGMPKSKLMVGIPTYGLIWKLSNPNQTNVGAFSTGRGEHGGGYITYEQMCMFLDDGAQRVFDDESKVPYAFKNYTWISYDDEESVALKWESDIRRNVK
ncbi:acidic mammalian chitinase-like [Ornithodoros turicata]|uniref:acidic mammalian chitinase-like n=1 Tax=Ornithodoros turicata TaxID=34597 RepID=UPI003138E655